MLHGCRLGIRQDFSSIDEWKCCNSWWRSPQLLGEEAKECRTVKLGERVVRRYPVGHAITGDPERAEGSWSQLQCRCRHRQRERHWSLTAPWSQCCIETRWSEETLVARSSCGRGSKSLRKWILRRIPLTCVPKRCLETKSANFVVPNPKGRPKT